MLAVLLNRALARSPQARAALAQMAGRNVRIETPLFKATLVLTDDGRLGETVAPPEATLQLPLAFFALRANDPAAAARRIILHGDDELGGKVGHALADLNWDAEEELSTWLGDAVAHRLVRLAGKAGSIPAALSGRLLQSYAEYWRDEALLLPRREEVERWLVQVDGLRDDIARLEKRLARLE